MSSEKKHDGMKAKGPATSKGPVFLEQAKRIGYDSSKLCQICEQGFHSADQCAKVLPGLYQQGKDWNKIVQELNEELEPPKHATYEDRQQEHHLAWDEEDRKYVEKQRRRRRALIRRESEEQTRRENEIGQALNSRMGSVDGDASDDDDNDDVPADLLSESPEQNVRRVRFATPPRQRDKEARDGTHR